MSEMDIIGSVGVKVVPIIDAADIQHAVEQAAQQASGARASSNRARSSTRAAIAAPAIMPDVASIATERPGVVLPAPGIMAPAAMSGMRPALPAPGGATDFPGIFGPMGVGERTFIGQRPGIEDDTPTGSGGRQRRRSAFDPSPIVTQIADLTAALPGVRNRDGRAMIEAAIAGYHEQLKRYGLNYDDLTASKPPLVTPEGRRQPGWDESGLARYNAPPGRAGRPTGGPLRAPTAPPLVGDDGSLAVDDSVRVNGNRGRRPAAPTAEDIFDAEVAGVHQGRSAGGRPGGGGGGHRGGTRRPRGSDGLPIRAMAHAPAAPRWDDYTDYLRMQKDRLSPLTEESFGRGQRRSRTLMSRNRAAPKAPGMMSRMMGSRFFGKPSSTGMFMNAMFGGYELAKAAGAAGDAAATAATYPGDFNKQTTGYVKAIEAVNGGILGSAAGFLADPFRTRVNAALAVQAAGQAGDRMAEMSAGRLRTIREQRIERQAKENPAGSEIFGAAMGAENAAAEVLKARDAYAGEDADQAAGYRASLMQRRGLGLKSYMLDTPLVSMLSKIDPQTRRNAERSRAQIADVDQEVDGLRQQQRAARGNQSRKDNARAVDTMNTATAFSIGQMGEQADDLNYRMAYGDTEADYRAGMRAVDKNRQGVNRALGAVEDIAVRLGFDPKRALMFRAQMMGRANRLFTAQEVQIGEQKERAEGGYRLDLDAIRGDTRVQDLQNRGQSFDAMREANRNRFDQARGDAQLRRPHDYESVMKPILDAQQAVQSAAIDKAEREHNQDWRLNLSTRRSVLQATIDAGAGRRSPLAPGIEGGIGGYKGEVMNARRMGRPQSDIDEIGKIARLEMDAGQADFFQSFRAVQKSSLNDIDTSGREFGKVTKDFSDGRAELEKAIGANGPAFQANDDPRQIRSVGNTVDQAVRSITLRLQQRYYRASLEEMEAAT